jgi:hypothetical protein
MKPPRQAVLGSVSSPPRSPQARAAARSVMPRRSATMHPWDFSDDRCHHITGVIMRRRSVLLSAIASALTGAVAADRARAREAAAVDLARHPLTGTYRAVTPHEVVPVIFAADGSVTMGFPPISPEPVLGATVRGPALGTWEAAGERRGHFTVIQALTDTDGTYLGYLTFEGHPTVVDAGGGFRDEEPQRVIVRDSAGTVVSNEVLAFDGMSPTRLMVGVRVSQLQSDIPVP